MMTQAKSLSISMAVAISMVLVTTAVLSGFGLVNYQFEKREQWANLHERLVMHTNQLSAGLTIPIWNIDQVEIARIIESVMKDPNVQQVRLSAADEVFIQRRDSNGMIVRVAEPHSDSEMISEVRPIFFGGEKIGLLEVFVTPRLAKETLKRSGRRYALLILFIDIVLVVSLYFLLWKIVLKPLRQVERYAVAVSSGSDAKAVLKGITFHAELDTLRVSIKKMVHLLETRIFEAKESEMALKAAKEKAESADRIKSEFLDIAAHELKTPLTPLTILIQLARRQFQAGNPIAEEVWDRLVLQVDRLTNLVRDLLEVSCMERGTLPLNPKRVDLQQLVSRCVQDFRDQSDRRCIVFEAKIKPIEVDVDPLRIYEVVSNLIDNAVKYSADDSPIEAKIYDLPGERVRVSITDQGQGISADQRQALFTRFFRVSSDATIRHSGLGLGLYICRRILELHQGSISVESELGKGSTFFFDLPRKGVKL